MKKLLLFSLVTIILCIFIVNSIDETDILKQVFNDEEIAFIKDNSISYNDISPYLKYQNFNIYQFKIIIPNSMATHLKNQPQSLDCDPCCYP